MFGKNFFCGLLWYLALIASCKSTSPTGSADSELNQKVSELIGPSFTAEKNVDGNFTLFYSTANEIGMKTFKFVVLESESAELVTEVHEIRGKVQWHDTNHLKITQQPSFVKDKDQALIEEYYFDVISGRRKSSVY